MQEVPLSYELTELYHTIRDDTSNAKKNIALKRLWTLLERDEYKSHVVFMENSSFLKLLVGIITQSCPEAVRNALACFWYISRHEKKCLTMPSLGLLPCLYQFIESNVIQDKEYSIKILSNCCLDPSTHVDLLPDILPTCSPFLSLLKEEITIRNPDYSFIFQTFHCIATAISNENVHFLVKYDIPGLVLDKLLSNGSEPCRWINRGAGCEYFALTFLANLSSLPNGAKAITCQKNPSSFPKMFYYFKNLLNCNEMEKIKSAIVVTNVISSILNDPSCQNGTGHSVCCAQFLDSILLSYPNLFPFLMNILVVTITENKSPVKATLSSMYFHYGMVRLRSLCAFLKNLSYFPSNRWIMVSDPTLLSVLLKILERYVTDLPELAVKGIYATDFGGGGRNDEDSVIAVLETLLQLSYHFEENETKKMLTYFKMMKGNQYDIFELLQLLQASRLDDEKNNNLLIIQYVFLLSNRLIVS
jgi:hypothetical protein